MTVRNQSWYNANASRPYPLDDAASGITDAGAPLPHHILVDLNLRFPESVATSAFLGAVSVTGTLVTVTILGEQGSDFVPLAAVSLLKPITQGRQYALTPLQDGVGGWLVLGGGVLDSNFTGRFSEPEQSRLAARCARSLPTLPK